MSQVGTLLAYANDGLWRWVDGEWFLPAHGCVREMAKARRRLGIPADRPWATKVARGGHMIERVSGAGWPFAGVGGDTLYGRSYWRRRKMRGAGGIDRADVPADPQVYWQKPLVGVPAGQPGKGRRAAKPRVLSADKPMEVRQLAALPETQWRRVWTTKDGEAPVAEWLVMRRDAAGNIHYALSNAPEDTPLERLAWGQCPRLFIEVSHREAKSEAGWDERRAQPFPAWEHALALVCLATWCIAQTKLDWREPPPRDPEWARALEVTELPPLSMAHVCEWLRAALPLPPLTVAYATDGSLSIWSIARARANLV